MPVATALTVYGIETVARGYMPGVFRTVATALTVYGIETSEKLLNVTVDASRCNSTYRLRY